MRPCVGRLGSRRLVQALACRGRPRPHWCRCLSCRLAGRLVWRCEHGRGFHSERRRPGVLAVHLPPTRGRCCPRRLREAPSSGKTRGQFDPTRCLAAGVWAGPTQPSPQPVVIRITNAALAGWRPLKRQADSASPQRRLSTRAPPPQKQSRTAALLSGGRARAMAAPGLMLQRDSSPTGRETRFARMRGLAGAPV